MPKRCCWASGRAERGAAAAALVALLPAAATACDLAGLPQRIETAAAVIAYRSEPAPAVGPTLSLDIAACAPDGSPLRLVGLDAVMPAHGHGTNYRTEIAARGPGRFRADGLLLHMPGRWQLLFDVETPTGRERLVQEVEIE